MPDTLLSPFMHQFGHKSILSVPMASSKPAPSSVFCVVCTKLGENDRSSSRQRADNVGNGHLIFGNSSPPQEARARACVCVDDYGGGRGNLLIKERVPMTGKQA